MGGHTMLSLILKQLDRIRVEEVVIVTGYMRESLQQHARLHAGKLHLKFVHNAESLQTNNAYSLFLAAPEVAGDPFPLSWIPICYSNRKPCFRVVDSPRRERPCCSTTR